MSGRYFAPCTPFPIVRRVSLYLELISKEHGDQTDIIVMVALCTNHYSTRAEIFDKFVMCYTVPGINFHILKDLVQKNSTKDLIAPQEYHIPYHLLRVVWTYLPINETSDHPHIVLGSQKKATRNKKFQTFHNYCVKTKLSSNSFWIQSHRYGILLYYLYYHTSTNTSMFYQKNLGDIFFKIYKITLELSQRVVHFPQNSCTSSVFFFMLC